MTRPNSTICKKQLCRPPLFDGKYQPFRDYLEELYINNMIGEGVCSPLYQEDDYDYRTENLLFVGRTAYDTEGVFAKNWYFNNDYK